MDGNRAILTDVKNT